MSKAVVLFVSHKYPPSVGGMEKQSYELIEGTKPYLTTYQIVHDGSMSIVQFFLSLNKRILALLQSHPEINTIHYNDGLLATLCLRHKGYEHLKRIVTVHGLDVVFPLSYYQKKILRKFNSFDHIIAVSRATQEACIQRGIAKEKITVVRNGIDPNFGQHTTISSLEDVLSTHHVPRGRRYIMLLGRPVKRKGFSWFIQQVLPLLNKEKYHLLLVGPFRRSPSLTERLLEILPNNFSALIMLFLGFPSDEKNLRTLLSDKRYNENITHLGKLPQEQLEVVLRSSDAFAVPNIVVDGDMEGFGLVCLEASISGAIVLAADLEGIRDAIQHRQNGYLIPSADAQAWKNAIEALEFDTNAVQRESFSTFTRQHYSWQHMIHGYLAVFEKMQCQN